MNSSLLSLSSAFAAPALVAMAMFIQVTRRMARMIVVLAGLFLLPRFVTVAVLIKVARLVSWMIVMLAWFFLGHVGSPHRVKSWSQRTATLIPFATIIRRSRWLASL